MEFLSKNKTNHHNFNGHVAKKVGKRFNGRKKYRQAAWRGAAFARVSFITRTGEILQRKVWLTEAGTTFMGLLPSEAEAARRCCAHTEPNAISSPLRRCIPDGQAHLKHFTRSLIAGATRQQTTNIGPFNLGLFFFFSMHIWLIVAALSLEMWTEIKTSPNSVPLLHFT